MYQIEYEEFLDKVHGGWYGKCLGGAAGAPVEGIKKLIPAEDFRNFLNPDLPNDDLDLQLLWLDVLENKGTVIDSCDLADAWIEKCWYPFSEYGYFMKNYMRGIKPPYTGIINNEFFKEGMGCPIRSEIWGMISAGNPKLATEYAYLDATLDHGENSVYAEQFLAAVESMAFFESDLRKLIVLGMTYIPSECRLHQCFETVLEAYDQGISWEDARMQVLNRYSHPDFTNVMQNMGFVLIALLYGEGSMEDTINIALRCGFDTDCTCASAASIIGILKGYKNLGSEITGLINDYFVCGIDVKRPSDSIRQLAEDTIKMALKTPNEHLKLKDCPYPEERPEHFEGFVLEKVTEEGLKKELQKIKPVTWELFGPYFEQLEQPMNPDYPSPHGEGCVLPDLVCMVNNQVFLEKEYRTGFDTQDAVFRLNAYEDFIDTDRYFQMQGQMCCYAKTVLHSPRKQKVWLVVGNNDGFQICVNGQEVLKKDEIRLWTPYNNFTLTELKEGNNEIIVKLLRRTEKLKFSIGFRCYDGGHWHRSKWCTDLEG